MDHVVLFNNVPTRGKTRIAVIDDSLELLELLQELLEDEGYEVGLLHASTGARNLLVKMDPALIILDVVIESPDSGWQLLQMLKLDPRTKHIPIIVCSAMFNFLETHQMRLTEHGCYIITKPFDLDELVALVSEALDKSRIATV